MKKVLKISLILLGIVVLIFCFYIYKLRTLALEGNKIFELRCTTVNPPLIAYKNAFLKQADILNIGNTSKSAINDYVTYYGEYVSGVRKYVVEENKWLVTNKKYINRWDFKLIEPWYIKQAAEYQQKMYESYFEDARGILDIIDEKIPVENVSLDHSENRKKLDDAKQKYFDFFDQALEVSDWRKFIGSLPVPDGCNEENMAIPDTSGAINWNGTPTPQPKVIPGLEDISG